MQKTEDYYVSHYVDIRRRDGTSLLPHCCVAHCREEAEFCHHTFFAELRVEIDLCPEHHREASR